MASNIEVSFIILNYNGLKDTCELIDSISLNVHTVKYEIIVVDNNSANNEGIILRERFPQHTIIQNTQNDGFAGGNNKALGKAKADFLFFINNDTIIKEDTISILLERFNNSPNVALICPKIKFLENNHIQYAGFTNLSKISLRNKGIGFGEIDKGQYDTPCQTFYAHGAAMIISRAALNIVGPMNESYFLYYEEIDWSEKIRNMGYEIWYDPILTIYHKESQTIGANSPTKLYYLNRNRLLFTKRNRELPTRYICYLYLTVAAIFHAITESKKEHRKAILHGILDFYKQYHL